MDEMLSMVLAALTSLRAGKLEETESQLEELRAFIESCMDQADTWLARSRTR